WAFYIQVAVPMRLPDAGRLLGSNRLEAGFRPTSGWSTNRELANRFDGAGRNAALTLTVFLSCGLLAHILARTTAKAAFMFAGLEGTACEEGENEMLRQDLSPIPVL